MIAVIVALLAMTACGGGSSSPTTPTPTPAPAPTPVPTPSPPPPAAFVCGAIGGFLGSPQSIINGLVCSGDTSPVVLVLLEDAAGKAIGFCSGTVIAPNAVVTAAHCLAGKTKHVAILPGGLGGRAIAASSFTPIPAYSATATGSPDVGVVIVGEDLGRTPLPLLVSRDVVPGEQGVVAGYGLDASGGQGVLHAGTVTIYRIGVNVFSSDFSGDVSNTCSGDSGGPLLVLQDGTWGIAGVTEAGESSDCLSGISNYARLRNDILSSFVFSLVPTARPL
ncbi:MAG: trypsin-like serine protease [Acidobacteria bacterium]|nr:trypsin-like serine protease [Acidobacteriota bacterium]